MCKSIITNNVKVVLRYLKHTNQLSFQTRFPKSRGKWLIHDTKRLKLNQLQSLELSCRISIQEEWPVA